VHCIIMGSSSSSSASAVSAMFLLAAAAMLAMTTMPHRQVFYADSFLLKRTPPRHHPMHRLTRKGRIKVPNVLMSQTDTSATISDATAGKRNKKSQAPTTSSIREVRRRQNRHEILFQKRLAELKEFVAENDHGSIPCPYPENPSLGVWASNLRRQYVIREQSEQLSVPYKGYLTLDRRKQLLDAGFDFTSLTERVFLARLEELREFKGKYGHTLVPEKYEENSALGAWVSNLRSLYKRRRRSESMLERGDTFKVVDTSDDSTIRREKRSMNILQHSHSPKRRKRKRSPRFSHLDDEKEALLEGLGFVWSSIDRKWFEMLEWAKVFGVVNQHLLAANVSISEVGTGNFSTGGNETTTLLLKNYHSFVQNIQDQSTLPYFHPQHEILELFLDAEYESKATMLVTPQTATSPGNKQLKLQSAPLLDYRVPANDPFHHSLRIWMTNQRSNYHRRIQNADDASAALPSTMTDRRQKALEEINFPWSGRFPNRYEELQFEAEQELEVKRQIEDDRRREQLEREEKERVDQILKAPILADDDNSSSILSNGATGAIEEEDDLMALWGAEDDDDW
jgi:hypothetical protein